MQLRHAYADLHRAYDAAHEALEQSVFELLAIDGSQSDPLGHGG